MVYFLTNIFDKNKTTNDNFITKATKNRIDVQCVYPTVRFVTTFAYTTYGKNSKND